MSVVELESVSKVFRSRFPLFGLMGRPSASDKYALRDVSLSVKAGEVLALMGPNGSGKTTLLKLIAGMLLPDSGRLLVHGFDISQYSQRGRSAVGYAVASERSFFPQLTGRENLNFFATLENIRRPDRPAAVELALSQMDLGKSASVMVAKYSAGMCQRLGLGRAILKRPSVLLLDEPTRSLDLKSAFSFWELVRRTADDGVTVVVASHSVEEICAVANRVLILREGLLVATHAVSSGVSGAEIRDLYFSDLDRDGPVTAGAAQ